MTARATFAATFAPVFATAIGDCESDILAFVAKLGTACSYLARVEEAPTDVIEDLSLRVSQLIEGIVDLRRRAEGAAARAEDARAANPVPNDRKVVVMFRSDEDGAS